MAVAPPQPDVTGPRGVRLAAYHTAMSPYELHFYSRLAGELPAELLVVNAYGDSSRDWRMQAPDSLKLVDLSDNDRVPQTGKPSQQLREWRRGGRVIQQLRDWRPDALILVGYNDLGRLRAAAWCRRHGVPVLLRNDSNLADEQRKSPLKIGVKKAFLRIVRRLTTSTLAVGPRGVDYWRAYGDPPERVFISPYEPDYSLVESVTPAEAAEAAQRHGLTPGRRRMVFSGRLIAQKRVDLLIGAFAQIAAQRPDWDLVILGDGELRDALAATIPTDLRSRVLETGFVADQQEMSRLYRACDLLVLPSDSEPWALVVNEAAAAGMAVVVSDVVGSGPALVREGVNGAVFPHGDQPALAEALLRVTDPAAIDRLKEGSAGVLADWRRDADPVAGVRAALRYAGVKGV